MNLKRAALVGVCFGMLLATQVHAGGDPVAGESKAQVCFACHGMDGNGVSAEYPRLAGQYESYMLKALQDYKSGARQNAIMASFVANLTDEDMADLAAYYASKEGLKDLSIK